MVATVRDEQASIESFVGALAAQSRPPDEIVLVDGGSSDGTAATIARLSRVDPRVRLIRAPGAGISKGRNIGIAQARFPVVAVTDAGTVADREWLEKLVAPLEDDAQLAVSSGFFVSGGATWFERCLSTIITPQLPEIDPARFLPSSRSIAFRREWWARVGGYPEWLRHCEDLVFDLDLRRCGARFAFTPDATVTWHARSTLRGFVRQYFDYARGDGRADLWARRHAIRYAAYGAGTLLAVLGRRRTAPRMVLAAGVGLHLRRPATRLKRRSCAESAGGRAAAWLALPAIVVAGDVAKMVGYPVGVRERVEQRARDVAGAGR